MALVDTPSSIHDTTRSNETCELYQSCRAVLPRCCEMQSRGRAWSAMKALKAKGSFPTSSGKSSGDEVFRAIGH